MVVHHFGHQQSEKKSMWRRKNALTDRGNREKSSCTFEAQKVEELFRIGMTLGY